MNKHFIILVSSLLIVLAGGCKEMVDGPGPPIGGVTLNMFFVDSEGKDLVKGITIIKSDGAGTESDEGRLSSGRYRISHVSQLLPSEYLLKLFLDDQEVEWRTGVSVRNMEGVVGEPPYYSVRFGFSMNYKTFNNKKVRYEVICPYIFGDYEAHILEGELDGATFSTFLRCRFDGVEARPVQSLPDVSFENAFIARINR
jgi:hypothetical protein